MVALSRALVVVAALLAVPVVASGQTASPVPVSPGQRVWVTLTTGLEATGKVDHVTNTTIAITTDRGLQSIVLATVSRIEKRDSVKNGARLGGIILGGYLGLGLATDGERLSLVGEGLVLGGVYGAGIGALIDFAVKRRDLVWEPPPRLALTFKPIATRHRVGLTGKVVW